MNFNHEELTLMMLYNTGTRMGLIHELRLMQCYLMPGEGKAGRDHHLKNHKSGEEPHL